MPDSEKRKELAIIKSQHLSERLTLSDVKRIRDFTPWWLECKRCGRLALMTPNWADLRGECRCPACGARYSIGIGERVSSITSLPLWLKKNFRSHVFWALNEEHLNYLEKVIAAPLRERPKMAGRRLSFSKAMPFNLPAWMLSAKNRADLLRMIEQLRIQNP
jgi:hypothetical protein